MSIRQIINSGSFDTIGLVLYNALMLVKPDEGYHDGNLPSNKTMQIENTNTNQVQNLIKEAHDIAVIPSKIAGGDAFGAAVGLYQMLKDSDKKVTLVYPWKLPENMDRLLNEEEIVQNVSQRELTVSIDYSGIPAGKAHYSTEDGVLSIRVAPIPKNFSRERVKTRIGGFDFDLIFIIGAQELRDLGNVYENLSSEFDRAKIVNIDNTNRNVRFGVINIIDTNAEGLSTLVFSRASQWGLTPGKRAAKALLSGITNRDGIDNSDNN